MSGPYATTDDVLIRAGRVGGVFTVANRRPNLADLETILDDVSADIDAEIRRKGFDPATISATVASELRDIAAYGALARGLRAAEPSGDAVESLLAFADSVWFPRPGALRAAQIDAVVGELGLEEAGTGSVASSFWTDEPDYGDPLATDPDLTLPVGQRPGFHRGQVL